MLLVFSADIDACLDMLFNNGFQRYILWKKLLVQLYLCYSVKIQVKVDWNQVTQALTQTADVWLNSLMSICLNLYLRTQIYTCVWNNALLKLYGDICKLRIYIGSPSRGPQFLLPIMRARKYGWLGLPWVYLLYAICVEVLTMYYAVLLQHTTASTLFVTFRSNIMLVPLWNGQFWP